MYKLLFLTLIMGVMFSACYTSRVNTYQPRISLENKGKQYQRDSNFTLSFEFIRVYNNQIEFNLKLFNKQKKAIVFYPEQIECIADTNGFNGRGSAAIACINPQEKLNELKARNKVLINQKNPYAAGESVGEIVTEALVIGTIATIFGQNSEELQQSVDEDENEWNKKHLRDIRINNSQIEYWETQAFPYGLIESKLTKEGVVSIPLLSNANRYTFSFKVDELVYTYIFERNYY